jgi:AcrR family transcriptional regulator
MSARLSAPERREQILTVSLEVFARAGYHGASMNDIADAAGVTKPVLYQHFESKRELFLALLEDVGNRLVTSISKATSECTDGKTQTEQGFRAYFRFMHESRNAFLLLFGSGPRRDEGFAEAVLRVEDASAQAIAPLIAANIDFDHQRTLSHALVGIAEGVARRLILDDLAFDPDLIARQVSDLAWAGLRAVGRPVV